MSAYGSLAKTRNKITYLPIAAKLKKGKAVLLKEYDPKYEPEVHTIMKKEVDDGQTYPFESMDTVEEFRAYFLSHDAYVCVDAETDEVFGAFYIKPNFPGRCSHLCNTGFVVKESMRQQGVASVMVPNYLQLARDLGYEGSFFNLVFQSNIASLVLWKKFGITACGHIPKAGKLKGLGYVDASQYYYDLTQLPLTKEKSLIENHKKGQNVEGL